MKNLQLNRNLKTFQKIFLALCFIFISVKNGFSQLELGPVPGPTVAIGSSLLYNVEDYIIPNDPTLTEYIFYMKGANGGEARIGDGFTTCVAPGGEGAAIMGRVKVGAGGLPAGTTLRFVAGVNGKSIASGLISYGGGGGGTAILYKTPSMSDFITMAVAGGGGGAYHGIFIACVDSAPGFPGSLGGATPGNGNFNSGGAGGINGGGGGGSGHAAGGGGAFLNGDGGNCLYEAGGGGKQGYFYGGAGGVSGCTIFGPSADGGFGYGGGGAGRGAGGGGGGFTGGGAGGNIGAGGGGGSFYGYPDITSYTFGPATEPFPILPNLSHGFVIYKTNTNTLPIANCRPGTVFLSEGVANLFASDFNNGSYDPDGTITSMTISPSTVDCSHVGTTQVTLTVTDNQGATASCVADVTVVDNIRPAVITQNRTIYLDASGNASITPAEIDNGSFDHCGISEMSLDKTSFNASNVGENTVMLKVVDNNGNFLSAPATVTVVDNLPPTVITQDITIYLDAAGTATITPAQINNGSTDNAAIQSMSLSKTTFNCSNVGANTVVLTVTDVNGNSASLTAIVTVVDNIAPTVITQNITIYLDATGNASITAAQINNGSTDNCAIQSMSLSKTDFNCSNVGANTVVLTVTDVNGNAATLTAIVTVVDSFGPIISSVSATPNRLWPVNHKMVPITVTINKTDNCTGSTCKIVSVASNEPTDGLGDGHTATDWAITGDYTLNLRAERAGNRTSRIYTITVECTDASGNKTRSTTTVLVPHDASAKVGMETNETDNNAENADISISNYPNPMSQAANIKITSDLAGKARLDFYNSTGKSLHTKAVELTIGDTIIPIDKKELKANGLIFYRLTLLDQTSKKPLVGKIIID